MVTMQIFVSLENDDTTRASGAQGAEIDVRIASSREDYREAFRIAYDTYHPLGFTAFSSHGMRATAYQFRPSTMVLLAFCGGEAAATMSLYDDADEGIPSCAGWPREIECLRAQGRDMLELGTLMVRPEHRPLGLRVCLALFRAAWYYGRYSRGADTFCAFVQAHHESFYRRMLGFSRFGPARFYEWNGLRIGDVTPLYLDFEDAEADYRERFERYGKTSRNLYYYFTEKDRAENEALLRRRLEERAGLDCAAMREEFAFLLEPSEETLQPAGSAA